MVLAARENWTDPIPVKALEMEYVDNLSVHTEWRADTRQEQQGV